METPSDSFGLEKFAEKLIKERGGVENVPPEVLGQMRDDLVERLEDRINALILKVLPKEKLGEFESLLDNNASDGQIQEFCLKHISGLDAIIAGELMNFRRIYLGV